jgi:hypothetical protein
LVYVSNITSAVKKALSLLGGKEETMSMNSIYLEQLQSIQDCIMDTAWQISDMIVSLVTQEVSARMIPLFEVDWMYQADGNVKIISQVEKVLDRYVNEKLVTWVVNRSSLIRIIKFLLKKFVCAFLQLFLNKITVLDAENRVSQRFSHDVTVIRNFFFKNGVLCLQTIENCFFPVYAIRSTFDCDIEDIAADVETLWSMFGSDTMSIMRQLLSARLELSNSQIQSAVENCEDIIRRLNSREFKGVAHSMASYLKVDIPIVAESSSASFDRPYGSVIGWKLYLFETKEMYDDAHEGFSTEPSSVRIKKAVDVIDLKRVVDVGWSTNS